MCVRVLSQQKNPWNCLSCTGATLVVVVTKLHWQSRGESGTKSLQWEKPLQQPSELQWYPALACCCPEYAWRVTERCAFLLHFGKSRNSKRFVRCDLLTKTLLTFPCYGTFIYIATSSLLYYNVYQGAWQRSQTVIPMINPRVLFDINFATLHSAGIKAYLISKLPVPQLIKQFHT